MALSFGNLIPSATSSLPYNLGYDVGDTRAMSDVYDDAPLRAVRTAGRPVAKAATNSLPLSYGSTVPKYSDPFASQANLSYGSSVPKSTGSFIPNVSDFLKTASFGFDIGDTRNIPDVYDDAVLRAARAVQPIPTVNTGTIDGGSSMMSTLKNLAKGALAQMGSTGDGEIIQASYPSGESTGINPLWIAGAALAAGAIYYVAAK